MGVTSGVTGAVNGFPTVFKWMTDEEHESELLVLSNSQAGQTSEGGVNDWRGFFLGKGHTPGVFPGDALEFVGDIGNGKSKTGTAICESLDITADVERGNTIQYNVKFSRNGAMTSTSTSVTDSSQPTIYAPTSLGVTFGSTPITDVRYWRLLLRNIVRPYCSSETAGGRKRTRGAMAGQFQIKAYTDDPSTLPTAGTKYVGKFYVTAPTYWQVSYCHVTKVSDLGADHNSEENVGATIEGVFASFNGTSIGSILDPAGATKWPFSA